MKPYKKLLVVANPTSQEQPALMRALELANHNDAHITVFLSIYDFSYEMTSILSSTERESMREGVINQRRSWLNDILKPYQSENVQLNCEVVWFNRPYESIINYAISGGYDLIIKGTHEHHKLKAVIFTPTDWHLLRKSPVPVLLVKEHEWPTQGKVLCAVNVGTDNEDEQRLNSKIIKHAIDLANKFNAQVHLVNGYPSTPVNLNIELPDFDAQNYNEMVHQQHNERITALAAEFDIPVSQCHVNQGLPEDVIPEVAEELDAGLVILGTIGRTGFSAALIGNTAENVIDSINCDLLAIKPDGYESPLA